MSFAACIPSSLRFFSICLDRAREALSSADMAHPMVAAAEHNSREQPSPPLLLLPLPAALGPRGSTAPPRSSTAPAAADVDSQEVAITASFNHSLRRRYC